MTTVLKKLGCPPTGAVLWCLECIARIDGFGRDCLHISSNAIVLLSIKASTVKTCEMIEFETKVSFNLKTAVSYTHLTLPTKRIV